MRCLNYYRKMIIIILLQFKSSKNKISNNLICIYMFIRSPLKCSNVQNAPKCSKCSNVQMPQMFIRSPLVLCTLRAHTLHSCSAQCTCWDSDSSKTQGFKLHSFKYLVYYFVRSTVRWGWMVEDTRSLIPNISLKSQTKMFNPGSRTPVRS